MKGRLWDGENDFEWNRAFMAGCEQSWEDSEVEDRSDHHQFR